MCKSYILVLLCSIITPIIFLAASNQHIPTIPHINFRSIALEAPHSEPYTSLPSVLQAMQKKRRQTIQRQKQLQIFITILERQKFETQKKLKHLHNLHERPQIEIDKTNEELTKFEKELDRLYQKQLCALCNTKIGHTEFYILTPKATCHATCLKKQLEHINPILLPETTSPDNSEHKENNNSLSNHSSLSG